MENERNEYIAVDLFDQKLVITIDPPEKCKANSIQHSFCPKMLEQIVSDLIIRFEADNQHRFEDEGIVDLSGRVALKRMAAVMAEGKTKESLPNKLGKLTVFALIRLFDARKAVLEFVGYIENRISNAFHSVTRSEEEWKFPPKCDISNELKEISECLQRQNEAIRRQQSLFEKYVRNYDGKPLGTVQWESYQRAGLKAALDDIISDEDVIYEQLKTMRDKLKAHC